MIIDAKAQSKLIKQLKKTCKLLSKKEFDGKVIPEHRWALKDGSESETDGYGEGTYFIRAGNQSPPLLVDSQANRVNESDNLFYAGCNVIMSIRFYATSHPKGGKRISCSLRGIQFVSDNDQFGGDRMSDDEFSPVENDDYDDDDDDDDDMLD